MPKPISLPTGDEPLHGPGADLLAASDATLLDFWRWAFSDLKSNTVRGIFAEWLVARLLKVPLTAPRDPWAACDLITAAGIRIEVKCSAYRQTWHMDPSDPNAASGINGGRCSTPSWTNLEARVFDPVAQRYTGPRTCNADLYVFCIHTTKTFDGWNALDLAQWQFFVLPQSALRDRKSRRLTESHLRQLTAPVSAAQLSAAVDMAAAALRATNSAPDRE